MLELTDISKMYRQGDKTIIAARGIYLKIKAKEFAAITGPSGCGKTTLLQIMSGLMEPSSGEVTVDGAPLYKMSIAESAKFRRRNIGYIFQNYNLIPFLTAEENIIMPVLLDGAKTDSEYLAELAEILGIADKMSHLPSEMSGGEQQRVAIARALINRPKLIFADEPTGNLDSETSERIMDLLLALNNRGNTIVMVTHNDELANRCGRRIFMKDGAIADR